LPKTCTKQADGRAARHFTSTYSRIEVGHRLGRHGLGAGRPLGAKPGFDARRYGHLPVWVRTRQGKVAMAPSSRSARGAGEWMSCGAGVLGGILTFMMKGLGLQTRAEEAKATLPSQNKCTSEV